MMPKSEVHATAIIEPGARLGDGVRIGPYCVVGGETALTLDTERTASRDNKLVMPLISHSSLPSRS